MTDPSPPDPEPAARVAPGPPAPREPAASSAPDPNRSSTLDPSLFSTAAPKTPRWQIGCGVVLALAAASFVFAVGSLGASVVLQAAAPASGPSSSQEATWTMAGGVMAIVVAVLAFVALVQRRRRR